MFPRPRFDAFDGPIRRIVENQEEVATQRITRNPAEQDLLETLIERSKPGTLNRSRHYLLGTPFRYPPLRHGSRFGSRHARWIFYGALTTRTCLGECAYYRFLFYYDQAVPPPVPPATRHTVFSVAVTSARAVDLSVNDYDPWRAELASLRSYALTQQLGAELRDAGCEVLVFPSARTEGLNVALFTEAVFAGPPVDQSNWTSQVTAERVMFRGPEGVFQFDVAPFLDGAGEFVRVEAEGG